jgi:hypothetical protein
MFQHHPFKTVVQTYLDIVAEANSTAPLQQQAQLRAGHVHGTVRGPTIQPHTLVGCAELDRRNFGLQAVGVYKGVHLDMGVGSETSNAIT